MATKRTNRPRGRRLLPLRNDRDRYALAYFIALYDIFGPHGFNPYRLARLLMMYRHGRFDTPEIREAVNQGRPFHVTQVTPDEPRGLCDPDAAQWRDQSAFNARADVFLSKARKLERKLRDPSDAEEASDDAKDAHWLGLMVTVWRLALGSYVVVEGDPRSAAADLAAKAGEADYFQEVIEPIFAARI